MLRLIRLLTIVIALSTILAVAVYEAIGSPVARARVTAAFGSCPFGQIREGQSITSQFPQVGMAILKRSHKLQDDGKYQVWNTPQGQFRYTGPFTGLDAFVLAEEELDIYRTYRIKPGFVVLDCGANVGTFTRRALNRGAAKVVAIEISADAQEGLRRTFANEIREGKVIVYPKGVWDKETDLDLRGDSVVLPRDGSPLRLPVTTIDKIVSELHLASVDFIKMDIEGAEKNALRGARATLAKYSPVMAISAEHLADDMVSIPAVMNELAPSLFRMEFGFCEFNGPFHAVPNVLHFSRLRS